MRSLAAFNAALTKKNLKVEMVKGRGYFYFASKEDGVPDWLLDSVYVNSYTQMSPAQWKFVFDDVVRILGEYDDQQINL
jgi:hypothetical protein